MKIERIDKGAATVVLYPDDCFWLARACNHALGGMAFMSYDQTIRLLSSTFAALGVATEAQVQMLVEENDKLSAIVDDELGEVFGVNR